MELQCASVAGGWQTEIKATGYRFGPVFNSITDLWRWQRENVFGPRVETV
mgnify:FL=1